MGTSRRSVKKRQVLSQIGAAIEVHRALGPGLLESAYQACLCHELTLQGLGCEAEKILPVGNQTLPPVVEPAFTLSMQDSVLERCLIENSIYKSFHHRGHRGHRDRWEREEKKWFPEPKKIVRRIGPSPRRPARISFFRSALIREISYTQALSWALFTNYSYYVCSL